MTKPRDPNEEPDYTCEWGAGDGEYEIEHEDGRTEQRPWARCNGTGVARFDATDVIARTRGEA